jgi:hypothetical protein
MRLMLSSLVIALASGSAASARQPPPDPVVHVGLFNYGQDGRVMGAAYENDQNALRSTVWTSRTGCQIGAGNGKAPAAATDAWEFSGRVLSGGADGATIQLDWRKTIDDGRPIAGTTTSQQLTLTKGQPVVLDSVTTLSPCAGNAVVFEARYDVDFIQQRIGTLPGRGGGGARKGAATESSGGFATGAGASSGSGLGGGRGGRVSAGAGAGSGAGSGAGAGAGSGGAVTENQAARAAGFLNVELWFIRNVGGQEEVIAHPTMRMTEDGASFSFAPITITSPKGAAGVVQVTGRLRVIRSPAGERQLEFTTVRRFSSDRRVTSPDAASVRDEVRQVSGNSTTTHPMPGPEEVLAFELPTIRTADGAVFPDALSVRLRIK